MPIVTNRLLITGAAALLALGVAGCSSDSAPTDPTDAANVASPVASPSVSESGAFVSCAAADAAQASLRSLTETEIVKEGTDAVRANFATFQTDVATLITSARADFAPEAEAVQASVDGLRTAIDGLTQSPSLSQAAAVAAAIRPVGTSLDALETAVERAC
ncbi:MAG: hypothetical protein WCF36_03465 [Candidatus Nanopelagicales bacterium]